MYVSLKSITTNTYTLPTSETLPTYHTLYNTLSITSETASSPPDPLPSSPPPSSLLVPSSSSSPSSSLPPSSPPPTFIFTPHSHLIPVSQLVVQMEHGAITPRTDETVTLGTEGQVGIASTTGDSLVSFPQVVAMTDTAGDEVGGEEAESLFLEGRRSDAGLVEQRDVHAVHVGVASVGLQLAVACLLRESVRPRPRSPPPTRRRRLRCGGCCGSFPAAPPRRPYARSSRPAPRCRRSHRSDTPNRPRS